MADLELDVPGDISYEMYFEINEMARKKGISLDKMVEDILREYIEKHEK